MANNDYDDEFDETADPVDDDVSDEGDVAVDADGDEGEGGSTKEKEKDILADAETLTVSSKEEARRQLEEEMERFLAAGGKIRQIPPDESADPPKRPSGGYGSRSI
ncbi:MAG: hypothetical protein H6997_02825 [Moraxellaceae bacterium]|nr:hypothetical protein [Moraxellaceae bacterium]